MFLNVFVLICKICLTEPRIDQGIAVAPVSVPTKKRDDLRYFTMNFKIDYIESFEIYFSAD